MPSGHDMFLFFAGLKRRLMAKDHPILLMMKNGLGRAHQEKAMERAKLILLQEKGLEVQGLHGMVMN